MFTFQTGGYLQHLRSHESGGFAMRTKQGRSAEDWERVKSIIRRLYIDEKRTLNNVMNTLEIEHGHKASVKMFKSRISQWELDKHNRAPDMAFLVRKKRKRDAEGKTSTFVVRSKEVPATEVDRYAERKRAQYPAFEEAPADLATPMHILCLTPPLSPNAGSVQDDAMNSDDHNTVPADSDPVFTGIGKRKRTRSPSAISHIRLVTEPDYRPIQTWTQSPSIPRIVTMPGVLRKPAMLFRNISSYVEGSISSRSWYLNPKGRIRSVRQLTVDPSEFYFLCEHAARSFRHSSALQGRRILSKAFSILPKLLREQHPRLLETVFDNHLQMIQQGFPEISLMIQRHIAGLARTVLPEGHIWQQICILISCPDIGHEEIMSRSWRCFADSLTHAAGRFSHSSVVAQAEYVCTIYHHTDPRRGSQLLRNLLEDYTRATGTTDETTLHIMQPLSQSLHEQKQYMEVEMLLEDALLRARQADVLSKVREAGILISLACARHASYKDDIAEKNLWGAIILLTEEFGEGDPRVTNSYCMLEAWLRRWGRDAEADRLFTEIDEMIGPDDIELDDTAVSTN